MDRQPYLNYKYYESYAVPIEVQVGVVRLELPLDVNITSLRGESIHIEARIVSDHMVTFKQQLGTFAASVDEYRNALVWDYVLSFPIKIQNLSKDSLLVLTAFSADGSVYGGTSMHFFEDDGVFKQGKQKLAFFFGEKGDPLPSRGLNHTPGDALYAEYSSCDQGFSMEKKLESYKVVMMRAQNTVMVGDHTRSDDLANDYGLHKQLRLGCGLHHAHLYDQDARLDWLDRLVLTQIQEALGASLSRDKTRARSQSRTSEVEITPGEGGQVGVLQPPGEGKDENSEKGELDKASQLLEEVWTNLEKQSNRHRAPSLTERALDNLCFLVVEMPVLSNPVLHRYKEYRAALPHVPPRSQEDMLGGAFMNDAGVVEFKLADRRFNAKSLQITADWDLDQGVENLAEEQSRKLAHSAMREKSDVSTKPNREQITRLQKIVDTPHGTTAALQGEERDLLYIFRYSLTDNKRALTKVLMSIDWDVAKEVAEVGPLLDLWRMKAPIDLADALKLLGRERAFQDERVRQYAIDILNTASDEEMNLFLLQLVQALRYEPGESVQNIDDLRQTEGLVGRGIRLEGEDQPTLAAAAHRASTGDFSDDEGDADTESVGPTSPLGTERGSGVGLTSPAGSAGPSSRGLVSAPGEVDAFLQSLVESKPSGPLAVFLISRACRSRAVANSLYWFLKVEAETDENGLFHNNLNALLYTLYSQRGGGRQSNSLLAKQIYCLDRWIRDITECQRDARDTSLRPMFTDKYAFIQEALNGLFEERGLTSIPEGLPSFPNPLDTTQSIIGLSRCSHIFKSAMVPCVVDVMAIREAPLELEEIGDDGPGNKSTSSSTGPSSRSLETPAAAGGAGGQGDSPVITPKGSSGGMEEEEDEEDWGMEAGDLTLDTGALCESTNSVSDALAVGDPVSPEMVQRAHATLRESGVSAQHSPTSRVSRAGKRPGALVPDSANRSSASDLNGDVAPYQFTQKLFFKQGDDLRTDQLILNLFSLMDSLLKKVNLDLRMRVYSVLATTQKDGIMEFVDKSQPVQRILDLHNKSIRNYLRKYNPDPHSPIGIAPDVLETYIRSCAGSCVCTYILGIGDRHLDNIMITQGGQLFHIDFGFVFGKDPKPLPSPFRLTREMAVAIGGENYANSDNFNRFKSYCFQSYNWLRKSSNLIINLLSLLDDNMIKSGGAPMSVPDVLKVVEDRLMLDLSEEEAESHFQGLIDSAINALMPQLVELAHIFAMKMK